MKAWQFQGGPGPIEQTLVFPSSAAAAVPNPTPTATEVLVQVSSTALNPVDYKVLELGLLSRLLFRKPVTPGSDFCGRVVEVGSEVTSFQVGDVVFGFVDGVFGHGALAEYVVVAQDKMALVPEGFEAEGGDDVGSIAMVGLTAYQSLKPYAKAGDRVFVNGGSGGTGVLAIQIAKAMGLTVTASCSTRNVELCKSLGADAVLDYTEADIIEQLQKLGTPFDLILDNVGAPANLYRASDKFLARDGTFVQVGLNMNLSGIRQLLGNLLLPTFLGGGTGKYHLAVVNSNGTDLKQLAAWVEKGQIKPVVDSVYGFEDAREAFARLKTGRARGKVVVRVKEM